MKARNARRRPIRSASQPPDLRSVADEHAVAEPLDQFDEPGAVTAGLDPDDHLAGEGGIEAADIIPLVIQLGEADRRHSEVTPEVLRGTGHVTTPPTGPAAE
jgi:hypothetical protein